MVSRMRELWGIYCEYTKLEQQDASQVFFWWYMQAGLGRPAHSLSRAGPGCCLRSVRLKSLC